MTSPTTPPSGGGMPKWLIILLVVLLVIILGCCGGFVTCRWACSRMIQSAQTAAQATKEQIQKDAQQRMKDEAQRLADEARQNATQPDGTVPGGGGMTGPGAAPGGGNAAGGGNPGGGTGTGNAGNNVGDRAMVEGLGSGKMPANFPTDVPVMKGLLPTGISMADKVRGSGMIALTGKVTREDATAFYDKQMKDQGWKETENHDIASQTIMQFTKDNRKAMVQILADDTNATMVNISYETTQ